MLDSGPKLAFLEPEPLMNAQPGMPPVTRALLFANVLAFSIPSLLYGGSGSPAYYAFMMQYGLVPDAFWSGAVWQPFTSMFLHGGMLHILANMLGLWSIGSFLERAVGPARFLGLYLVSGLVGAAFVIFFPGPVSGPTVGASGAVLGLLGAMAVLQPRAMLLVFFIPMRTRTAVILFGLLSILAATQGWLSFISHMGHLGGLVGGLVYTWLAISRDDMHRRVQDHADRFRTPEPDAPNARDLREAMLRQMMDRLGRGAPRSSGGEKVINPLPGETGGEPTGPRRKVYFDPITGRYVVIYEN